MSLTSGIRAGAAFVEVGVRDKLAAGLKRASARLRAFGSTVTGIGRQLIVGGAAVAAPLLLSVRVFSKFGDTLDKMSKRTGVAVETLSELDLVANRNGTSLAVVEKGIKGMNRVILDSSRGLADAKENLDDLGLSAEQLMQLPIAERFKLIADRLSQISDIGTRRALAEKIFGRAGGELVPMMERGAAGIEELQQKARDLGVTFLISTDAHHIGELSRMQWGTQHATRGSTDVDRIANTWPREKFLAWAAARRR